MFEEEDDFLDLSSLLSRYEKMQAHKTVYFFDVEEFEALSDHFYLTGKARKALDVVNQGLEQHPAQPSFFMRRAQIYTSTNLFKEAHSELQKVEALSPEGYDLFMARAALASKQEEHTKAISLYKKALPYAEFEDEVWPMIALEYQAMGKYEKAIKYLKMTLFENAADDIAVYNIALCYDVLGCQDAGVNFFKDLIETDPYNELAWYHLGLMHGKLDEHEEAIRAYDYCLLIDEYFTAAYFEKARIYELTFRFQEAVETYLETFENEGPTGFSYYKVGLCYLKLHKENKALNYFTKAVHEDEELDEAFFELALLHDDLNQHQDAVHNINRCLALDADNTEYMYTGANIHRRAGLLDEAEQIFAGLLEAYPNEMNQDVYLDYAQLLFDLCQFETGMTILYRGIEVNPEADTIHYRLAGYLFTLRENDEATIYLKKAVKLNPAGVRYFFNLFPDLKNNAIIREALATGNGM